ALVILVAGYYFARDLKIGDLDPGAPELRADSRYNRDNAYLNAHYVTSPDVFVVMAKTAKDQCGSYPVAAAVDRLQQEMEAVPGVDATMSLFDMMKMIIASSNGGDLKWFALSRDRYVSNAAHHVVPPELYNGECSMAPV